MGPVYDVPREELTPEQVDASLRYQIMEVVDRIRWIPDFGYERELDWLLQHGRLDDQQEALLGAGAADLRLCGVRHGRRRRRARRAPASARSRAGTRSRATPRTDRGSTRCRIACSSCGEPVERIHDVGNPWLDAGIVPFSTLHFREDPDYWAKWFPADFITESFPGPVPQLVLLDARDVDGPPRARRRSRRSSGTPSCSPRTAARCTRAGATRSSSTRRPSGWASTSCAGCSPRRGPRTTSLFGWHAARRGAARAAHPVERVRVLRDLRPAGGLDARRSPATAPWRIGRRSIAGSCRARPGPRRAVGGAPARRTTRSARRARCPTFLDDLSTWYLRLSRRRFSRSDDPPTGRPPSRRSTRRSSRRPGCSPRSCRSCRMRCTGTS